MSKVKLLLTSILLYVISAFLFSCTPHIDPPPKKVKQTIINKSSYTLEIGETFTIELYSNGSTGYSNCWVNDNRCGSVILAEQKYISSEEERKGCDGCIGTSLWTFEATSKGIDTVQIEWCPTGRLRQDCAFFRTDSLTPDNINQRRVKHGKTSIIVKVLT